MKARIFVVFMLLAGLAGCGGGSDSGGGAPQSAQVAPDMSSVPESMTLDQRMVSFDTAVSYWDSINTGTTAGDNQALLSYLASRTDIADYGVSDDATVWARFKDGFPMQFITVEVPPGTVLKTQLPAVTSATPAVSGRNLLPAGDKAVLLDVDMLADGSLTTIEPALTNKGYVTSKPVGTVADFMAASGASVLFISSHGGEGTAKDGTKSYAVMTNERVDFTLDPNSAAYNNLKTLNRSGELIMSGVHVRDTGASAPVTVYGGFWAITEKFVKNNWSFAKNSLVVLDTCELFKDAQLTKASEKVIYQNFRAALTGANAGSIVGWDGQVSPSFAGNVMQLFFDRVLGANAYQAETPKQRPFSYSDVLAWLKSKGKDRESGGGGLTLQETGRGLLAPTIIRANLFKPASGAQYAGKWVLELSGEFGTDDSTNERGTLTVNGIAPTILDWSNNSIHVELPASLGDPGGSGDVIVDVRNHKSNILPLTQWTGTVSQAQTGTDIGSGAQTNVSCPVRVTGDVHFSRSFPGEVPHATSVAFPEITGSCTYTLSGSWTAGSIQYSLTGNGSAAPALGVPDIYGSLMHNANGTALPLAFQAGVAPMVSLPGTLTAVDPTGPTTTTSTVNGSWAFAYTGVNSTEVTLGASYVFSASRPCVGLAGTPPTSCTETWNLTPATSTVPTVDTES